MYDYSLDEAETNARKMSERKEGHFYVVGVRSTNGALEYDACAPGDPFYLDARVMSRWESGHCVAVLVGAGVRLREIKVTGTS
jgi:hypothetical protein